MQPKLSDIQTVINTIIANYHIDSKEQCEILMRSLSLALRTNFNISVRYNMEHYSAGRANTTLSLLSEDNTAPESGKATPSMVFMVYSRSQKKQADEDNGNNDDGMYFYTVFRISGKPLALSTLCVAFAKPAIYTLCKENINNLLSSGYSIYHLIDGTRVTAYYDDYLDRWAFSSNRSANIGSTAWRGYTFSEIIEECIPAEDLDNMDKNCCYNIVVYNSKIHSYKTGPATYTVINVYDKTGAAQHHDKWQQPIAVTTGLGDFVMNNLTLAAEEYNKYISGKITHLGDFMGFIIRKDTLDTPCYAVYSKLYSSIRKILYKSAEKIDIEMFANTQYMIAYNYYSYAHTNIIQKLFPDIAARMNILNANLLAITHNILYNNVDHKFIREKKLEEVKTMYESIRTPLTDKQEIVYSIVEPDIRSATKVTGIYKPSELKYKIEIIMRLLNNKKYINEYVKYLSY